MKITKKIYFLIVLIFSFLYLNCGTTMNYEKLNIKIDNQTNSIFPLRYFGGNVNIEQSDEIMKMIYKIDVNEYGYYYIRINDNSNFVVFTNYFPLNLIIPFSILGIPYGKVEREISVLLYIFDSNGNLIKTYKKSKSYSKYRGIYYGHNNEKIASKEYESMFSDIINMIKIQSEEINELLENSGIIDNEEKNKYAYRSLYNFVVENEYY